MDGMGAMRGLSSAGFGLCKPCWHMPSMALRLPQGTAISAAALPAHPPPTYTSCWPVMGVCSQKVPVFNFSFT